MSKSIAEFEFIRGETITFGFRSSSFLGTETITSAMKRARNGNHVPPQSEPVVRTATPTFVAGSGDVLPAWHFTIVASDSAQLEPASYILDAKIVFADGVTDVTRSIVLKILQGVTS